MTIEEMLTKRPLDRTVVDDHKKRILDEVRADHRCELREATAGVHEMSVEPLHAAWSRVSRIDRGDLDQSGSMRCLVMLEQLAASSVLMLDWVVNESKFPKPPNQRQ